MREFVRAGLLAALLLGSTGCNAGWELARYVLLRPLPALEPGEELTLPGLRAPVEAVQRPDGLVRVRAENESDAMLALGYLQARDRMGQLDVFRHLAGGELAALIGDRPFGDRSALDVDRLNRFLGFRALAEHLFARTSSQERLALQAFASGVNHWIEHGPLPLEHRLLGVTEIRPWTPVDSLAIYQMIMHGLGGNADREVRRLVIACEAGADAVDRVWPMGIEFEDFALPEADLPAPVDEPPGPPPALVEALAAELPERCTEGVGLAPLSPFGSNQDVAGGGPQGIAPLPLARVAAALRGGLSASNNWAVAGTGTRSGLPIFSSDPHLPHMNPPIAWGMDVEVAGARAVGFTLVGLHRVVFGHNGRVAWGATTNHVDRQDLVVHRLAGDGQAVEIDGRPVPFQVRSERFAVRGGAPVELRVRFTDDGPLLNDLDPAVAGRIPVTALRRVAAGRGSDLDGARAMQRALSAAELARALGDLDLGCSSWLFADAEGHIGFRSPCLVPVREGWRGTFPVPGWLTRYRWRGVLPKDELPASDDPARGWLATANGQILPSDRLPTAYNADASAPDRLRRIGVRLAELREAGALTAESSAAIQHDAFDPDWPQLKPALCTEPRATSAAEHGPARTLLCEWDGEMAADSAAASLFVLWTHAVLDRALADELSPDTWQYVQSLPQFEVNVHWLWRRPEQAPVWDDVRTPGRETRSEVLDAAIQDAHAEAVRRFGSDPADWAWGEVRPFTLRHAFAGDGGPLGLLVNAEPLALPGGTETVFKQQFPRSDREHMHPTVGPVARFSVDLAAPWDATFSLAGGQSGWPLSPFYANLLADWATGSERPLTPKPSDQDVSVRFVPAPEPSSAQSS